MQQVQEPNTKFKYTELLTEKNKFLILTIFLIITLVGFSLQTDLGFIFGSTSLISVIGFCVILCKKI